MMHLNLVFVGKTNFPEIETGIQRYLDRLAHYIPTRVHGIKAEKILPKSVEDQVRERESARILKLVGQQGHLVLWDQRGRQLDSPGLAHFLDRLSADGTASLWMVIGGPLGVSDALRGSAHTLLSLSKMTLPHDMARLIVVEQLYRAFTILKGEPYHR